MYLVMTSYCISSRNTVRTRRRKEERFRDFTLAYSVIKITDADDDVLEEKENNNDKQSAKRMERIKRSMLLLSFYLCVYEAEAEVRGHSSRSRDEDDFLRSISEPKERCLFRGQHHRGGHLHPVSAIVKPML